MRGSSSEDPGMQTNHVSVTCWLLQVAADGWPYCVSFFSQDGGARGKVEAMHLDLSSFRWAVHPCQCSVVEMKYAVCMTLSSPFCRELKTETDLSPCTGPLRRLQMSS